ncbi:PemK-like protein [Bernardetia litoralis DSM 6794]|uniref:PemK-like protein n=1 Tax=Bernardetia litoralis (strain ATCC 23117 / DSM 6794 / NBRC 15988 / NCIMB 1366 / Fx l1 / Sio-4) TaxID=880071 RepID=I4AM20_BERLS|nr:type II toxin-antitoxin system PemK/MazF family toxin [Bernardetia litoralis]AFM05005.1 PemK-like protein [Bernardetia litoralis DSM 6794]
MEKREIWLVNLPKIIKDEKDKMVFAIITSIGTGSLSFIAVLPLIDWKEDYISSSSIVKIENNDNPNLEKVFAVDCWQVQLIYTRDEERNRFIKKIGMINETTMQKIHETIADTFDWL